MSGPEPISVILKPTRDYVPLGDGRKIQVWEGRTEECDDPRESCNIDECHRHAMPDGSLKTSRNHTW